MAKKKQTSPPKLLPVGTRVRWRYSSAGKGHVGAGEIIFAGAYANGGPQYYRIRPDEDGAELTWELRATSVWKERRRKKSRRSR